MHLSAAVLRLLCLLFLVEAVNWSIFFAPFLLLASAHLPVRALQVAVKDLRRGRFVPPLAQSCCPSVRLSGRRSSFPVYFCRVLFNVFFAAHAQLLQRREKTNVNKEKILSARDTTGSWSVLRNRTDAGAESGC